MNGVDPEGEFIVELLVLTIFQTALQSAMQNGSWWDNFKDSFEMPFSGRGKGQFWENMLFNSIAIGIGMTPGLNMQTGLFLGVDAISSDLKDEQEREGYSSNYLGFKVGQLYDVYKVYKIYDYGYTGFEVYQQLGPALIGASVPYAQQEF